MSAHVEPPHDGRPSDDLDRTPHLEHAASASAYTLACSPDPDRSLARGALALRRGCPAQRPRRGGDAWGSGTRATIAALLLVGSTAAASADPAEGTAAAAADLPTPEARLDRAMQRLREVMAKVQTQRRRAEAPNEKVQADPNRIESERRTAPAEWIRAEAARDRARTEHAVGVRRPGDVPPLGDIAGQSYLAQIEDKVERNWLRPPGIAMGLRTVVRIGQIPGGEVIAADTVQSSGNVAFDRSVEEAVLRSSPLPAPGDPRAFQRNVLLVFQPDGASEAETARRKEAEWRRQAQITDEEWRDVRSAMAEMRRREADRALQEQIARDAAALEQERRWLLDVSRVKYIAELRDKIDRNWVRPPGVSPGLRCVVRVSQRPGGHVVEAEIQTSSGDVALDRSVQEAILRASPLPVPRESLFDHDIVITFAPGP